MSSTTRFARRAFLGAIGGTALFTTRGLFAEALTRTTPTTEGPFYPDTMPLDTDNDLLIINDAITPAVGEVTWLSGRVLTESGAPIRNAFVEIWQCDAKQSYLHTQGRHVQVDANFQGYGRYLTDSSGRYAFRTIKPVSYTLMNVFRAPHIHMAVSRNGQRLFTTQIGVRGHADNARDPLFKEMTAAELSTIMIDFSPTPGLAVAERDAAVDLVLNRTAFEGDDGVLRGVGKSTWEGFGRGRSR